MARKKVKLAYIRCDTARRSTYRKRKKGVLKKIDELSTLCGVEACAVICSPYEPEPVVWPDSERAGRVVEQFRNLSEMDQKMKMFDHPKHLHQQVEKTVHQLNRLQRDNRVREVTLNMHACMSAPLDLFVLNQTDLDDVDWMADHTIKEIGLRLQGLHPNNNNININNNEAGDDVAEALALVPAPEMMPPTGYLGQFYQVAPGGFGGASSSGGGAGGDNMDDDQVPVMMPSAGYLGQFYQVAPGGFGGAGGDDVDEDQVPPAGYLGQFYQVPPGGFDGASSSEGGCGSSEED